MKVFVTGGTGFVGSHLIEALLAQGVEVFALMRNPKKPVWLAGTDTHVLKGTLFSIPPLPRDLDAVYHLAGVAKSSQTAVYYTVNHLGTASLLAALDRQGIKTNFVFVSTISAGGPSPPGGFRREDDPPRPISPYGRSKLRAEREVLRRRDAFPVTIVRPGFIVGPRDRDFLELLKIIRWGIKPMLGRRVLRVSSISIRDAVRALLRLLRPPARAGSIYNLAFPEPIDTTELVNTAAALIGRKTLALRIPVPAARWASFASGLAARVAGRRPTLNMNLFLEMCQGEWAVDTRKAADELSFTAEIPFKKALAETLAWYVETGWLRGFPGRLPDGGPI
ncbi:MAG: NAD(P)-dependent oxidoreductase [Candidatus Aminicenantes bacterium]|nr:NAD(P)-dependent oxidoreductase [Candidatus Aminicenantes bacterium]